MREAARRIEGVNSIRESVKCSVYLRLEKRLAKKWPQLKASILSAKGYRMSCVTPMRQAALKEMAPVEGVNVVSERV